MKENKSKCNCEEMSCKEGCTKPHTHKGFSCDKYKPTKIEQIREYNMPSRSIDGEEWIRMVDHNYLLSEQRQSMEKAEQERATEVIRLARIGYGAELTNKLENMNYAGVLESNELRRGYDIARQEILQDLKDK